MKKITAFCWLIASSTMLWLFSLTQNYEFSPRPQPIELIDSFLMFTFMLIGGGCSYHFFTEILNIPYTANNKKVWSELLKSMILLMLLAISGPFFMVCFRDYSNNGIVRILCILYLFFSFGLASIPGKKIEKIYIQNKL